MRPSFASQVDLAISRASDAPSLPDFPPDPDDWLNVDSADFDAMLEGSMKQKPQESAQSDAGPSGTQASDASTQQEDQLAQEQAARLRNLAQKVEDFVEGKGDLEGAIFSE